MENKAGLKTLKRAAEAIEPNCTSNKKTMKTMRSLKIIYETKYALNKSESKFISVGIDVENWIPILRISGSNGVGIHISGEDWEILTNDINTTKIDHFFKNGHMESIEMNGSGLTVTGRQFNKINILTFKNIENFYISMAEISVRRLFEISSLVNLRKAEIEELEIRDHYTDVLFACIQLGGDAFQNFKDVARSLGQYRGINLYCMTELLYMYPETIIENLSELVVDKL